MKRLFLTSSFADTTDIFMQFTQGEAKDKTVTFIPTASIHEKINFYVEAARKSFLEMGVKIDELDISTAMPHEISNKLEKNDYIYVSGGNTFFLLQELQRTGADKIISRQIEAGKLYIGESAGSIVLAPDIDYIKTMDDISAAPELISLSSLALISFYPLPHHTNFPFKETVERIIATMSDKITLCPFSNTQVIIVNEDKVDMFGI
ncbi:MAG: Type 1 glutamine amidotransferase-like domain-containing protein [Aeromonas popoffii]|uniref:Type 1 glutamine amidotransferase-like domain-containing protein n=1 Tax=Aeromonas TaxID=642 RepID=UPI00257A0BFA|nr:Type 1 glutamine amidotransferase-like domain-containing protein [Aeromonas sp.]